MEESPKGIDVPRVTSWFREQVPAAAPPLRFDLIAGGHSNLTYRVTDAAGGEYVLRRPPLHHVLPTAHDMGREHKIIAGLASTAVPVPPALGFCAAPEVNGAPFYVMTFVHGHVLHDRTIAEGALEEAARRHAGEHFIDVLADLHAVDPDAVGLGDLGRKEGYVSRQLKRWYSQWQQSKTRELPAVDRVHDALQKQIPEQARATVVHGDYRLGNCITSERGRIMAVLDWEICTLGDPLADVGYVLATWSHSSDEHPVNPLVPSMVPGFPTRAELLERYAARSGADVSRIDFYVAFSYWKSACIIEGVYARYLGGARGDDARAEIHEFPKQVERFAALAEDAVARFA
ncbi:MAG: hypothetical protein QOD06_2928 [Candidatus Binatota bacterium]|nr:hypothetical protein [Candidatus Binatota bacterium]